MGGKGRKESRDKKEKEWMDKSRKGKKVSEGEKGRKLLELHPPKGQKSQDGSSALLIEITGICGCNWTQYVSSSDF